MKRLVLPVARMSAWQPVLEATVVYKKPFRSRLKRVLGGAAAVFIFLNIGIPIVLSPLEKHTKEVMSFLSAEERLELEREILRRNAEGTFIPIPWTLAQVKAPRYARDGPESKELSRFAHSPEKIMKARGKLVASLKSWCANIPDAAVDTGSLSVKYQVLHVDYPARPANNYVLKGIHWKDGEIALVTRPIPGEVGVRLEKIWYPWPLALAVTNFCKALGKQQASSAAGMLGFGSFFRPSTPQTPQPPDPHARQSADSPTQSSASTTASSISNRSATTTNTTTRTSQRAPGHDMVLPRQTMVSGTPRSPPPPQTPASSFPKGWPTTAQDSGTSPSWLQGPLGAPIRAMFDHTQDPRRAFRQTFLEKWRPRVWHSLHGCVQISGWLELENRNRSFRISVYCIAYYDPRREEFAQIEFKPKRIALGNRRWVSP